MNKKTTRNILLSCAVLVVITCICVGLILVSGVGVSLFWPFDINPETGPNPETNQQIIPQAVTSTPNKEVQPTSEPDVSETDPTEVAEPLPADIADIVLEIEGQVNQIRGLDPVKPVPKILMSPEALEDKVVNEFFADYSDEDARQDVLVLSLLGLLPSEFDLKDFYNQLYSEQISGFYDSETEEIYIVRGADFDGGEKLTYAHEFTHVLQDQTFSFDEGLNYNEDACEEDSERCAAIQSLIEGDASFTEMLWFQNYATRVDYQDIMQMYEEYDSPIFDTAPAYMQLDLLFPYEKGFTFVESLYNQGGFDAIDAAFLDPPVSTEQIIHPDQYPWDQPQLVTLPNLDDILGGGWMLFDQNVMGEWYTYLILGQSYSETYRIPEDQALNAAGGWGGDAYAFYLNEETDEVIFILDLVWDSLQDADEFMAALASYADLRWDQASQGISGQATWKGPEGTVVLMQDGDRTLWMIAPTDSLAETIFTALQ